jgi:hypothetical protein
MPQYKVLTGVKVVLAIGTKVVGFATSIAEDEDLGAEEVRVLGEVAAADIENVRYGCRVRMSAFVVDNRLIEQAGLAPSADTLLQSGAVDIRVMDKLSGELKWTYEYCKCASKSVTVTANALTAMNTTWVCRKKVIPDAVPVPASSKVVL